MAHWHKIPSKCAANVQYIRIYTLFNGIYLGLHLATTVTCRIEIYNLPRASLSGFRMCLVQWCRSWGDASPPTFGVGRSAYY